MTTSGLVVTLHPDPEMTDRVVNEMVRAGVFTLGDRHGDRLAVALEADTPRDSHDWHEWLEKLPGVVKVDVAFVSTDPAVEEAAHEC